MNPVLALIDAGHVAAWGLGTSALSVLNAMQARKEVAGLCKRCGEPWACTPIRDARLAVRVMDMQARKVGAA